MKLMAVSEIMAISIKPGCDFVGSGRPMHNEWSSRMRDMKAVR